MDCEMVCGTCAVERPFPISRLPAEIVDMIAKYVFECTCPDPRSCSQSTTEDEKTVCKADCTTFLNFFLAVSSVVSTHVLVQMFATHKWSFRGNTSSSYLAVLNLPPVRHLASTVRMKDPEQNFDSPDFEDWGAIQKPLRKIWRRLGGLTNLRRVDVDFEDPGPFRGPIFSFMWEHVTVPWLTHLHAERGARLWLFSMLGSFTDWLKRHQKLEIIELCVIGDGLETSDRFNDYWATLVHNVGTLPNLQLARIDNSTSTLWIYKTGVANLAMHVPPSHTEIAEVEPALLDKISLRHKLEAMGAKCCVTGPDPSDLERVLDGLRRSQQVQRIPERCRLMHRNSF